MLTASTGVQLSTSSNDTNSQPQQSRPPELPVSWLNSVLPAKALPYAHLMRLDKPIGISPGYIWLLQHAVLVLQGAQVAYSMLSLCCMSPTGTLLRQALTLLAYRHMAASMALLLVHCPGSPGWQWPRPAAVGAVRHWGYIAAWSRMHSERSLGQGP